MKIKKLGKKNAILTIILIVLLLLAGGSLAFFGWSSTSEGKDRIVDVTVNSGSGECSKLTDNTKLLVPTSSRNSGRIITMKTKQIMAENAVITWTLTVNKLNTDDTTTSGLKNESFKYELINNTTGVSYGSGNFANITDENNTITFRTVEETLDYNVEYQFILYLWIDGVIFGNNPLDMASQEYNFDMNCNITGVDNKIEAPNYLSTFISNLYNNSTSKTEVTSNNISYSYATDESIMNDRLGSMETPINAGNIRYYGEKPNNYIYFNCDNYNNPTKDTCEVWRIVGVFDGKVKIVKNNSIGKYVWDSSSINVNYGIGINEWSQADLMKLLNPGYENNYDLNSSGNSILVNNSLYWQGFNSEVGYCYNAGANGLTSCDFTKTGLKNDTTRNMISTSIYYFSSLPTSHHTTLTMNEVYNIERGGLRGDFSTSEYCYTFIPNCDDTVKRTGFWNGKISLLYLSDYGYASDLNLCKNKTNENYKDEVCTSSNWIYYLTYNNNFILNNTIDQYSKNSVVVIGTVDNVFGTIANGSTTSSADVYPTLHLNSNTIISTIGDGSENNPYRIITE